VIVNAGELGSCANAGRAAHAGVAQISGRSGPALKTPLAMLREHVEVRLPSPPRSPMHAETAARAGENARRARALSGLLDWSMPAP
jgi:hypothetical protein